MSTTAMDSAVTAAGHEIAQRYRAVRAATVTLSEPLSAEDCQVQSMPDASPAKWHLAHTSWFFETFLLKPSLPGYREFDPGFDYLFNSYYYTLGEMHARPRRGMLTRPSLERVYAYRDWVDEHMDRLFADDPGPGLSAFAELGMHHEQQHQELLLTDIKHLFSINPLHPAYSAAPLDACAPAPPLEYIGFDGGLAGIGHDGDGFAFDNECPRHEVMLNPFSLANRPVTNGEFKAFIQDGGYRDAQLWLSDGWAAVQQHGLRHPMYWHDGLDTEFTLHGEQPLDPNAPACHISHFEADAFARWAGARLPTEAEWETAAASMPVEGQFLQTERLHPGAARGGGLMQLFGGVWEWTASAYLGYPGFRPPSGATGEYNGKFMSGQLVMRGGSCATPPGHIRASYRNFMPPAAAWQFTGVRLARDA